MSLIKISKDVAVKIVEQGEQSNIVVRGTLMGTGATLPLTILSIAQETPVSELIERHSNYFYVNDLEVLERLELSH